MKNSTDEIDYESFVSKKDLVQALLRIRDEIDRVLTKVVKTAREEKKDIDEEEFEREVHDIDNGWAVIK